MQSHLCAGPPAPCVEASFPSNTIFSWHSWAAAAGKVAHPLQSAIALTGRSLCVGLVSLFLALDLAIILPIVPPLPVMATSLGGPAALSIIVQQPPMAMATSVFRGCCKHYTLLHTHLIRLCWYGMAAVFWLAELLARSNHISCRAALPCSAQCQGQGHGHLVVSFYVIGIAASAVQCCLSHCFSILVSLVTGVYHCANGGSWRWIGRWCKGQGANSLLAHHFVACLR